MAPSLLALIVFCCCAIGVTSFGGGGSAPAAVDVFVAGDEPGVQQYRIPALVVTGRGTLLAFSEARTDGATDCAYKWLVVRRSADNGATWSASVAVAGRSDTGSASGNPQAVFHAPSGSVVVTYGVKLLPGGCSPGDGVFVVDDGGSDGLAWGAPRNISGFLGELWGGVVPGPGAGIVTSARSPRPGRIVFSGSSGAYNRDVVFFSDNGGLTWAASKTVLLAMDESAPAELADGSLYLSMRNADANRSCDCQAYSTSADAGETWSTPISYDPTLISPQCEASVLAFGGSLYFANPASTTARRDTTIRRTVPQGPPNAWESETFLVQPGLVWGGYTSMGLLALQNETVGGILFERNNSAALVISFMLFPLSLAA